MDFSFAINLFSSFPPIIFFPHFVMLQSSAFSFAKLASGYGSKTHNNYMHELYKPAILVKLREEPSIQTP